jgi:hypothetical protein
MFLTKPAKFSRNRSTTIPAGLFVLFVLGSDE